MFFLKKIITGYREKKKANNDKCNQLISCIDDAIEEANRLFNNPQVYVKIYEVDNWKKRHTKLIN